MSSFPANKISGLGLINERIKSLETADEYIFLNITNFSSDAAHYGQLLFQNKIIILADVADLSNINVIGIPHPSVFPREDGFKIRFISNFAPVSETETYQFYTLDSSFGMDTQIHSFFGKGSVTLVWNETGQTWFPICNILPKNASVFIANPDNTTTTAATKNFEI